MKQFITGTLFGVVVAGVAVMAAPVAKETAVFTAFLE